MGSCLSNQHQTMNSIMPAERVEPGVYNKRSMKVTPLLAADSTPPVEPPPAALYDHTCHASGLLFRDAADNSHNLVSATKAGNSAVVTSLLQAGADVNSEGMWGNTPLLVACQHRHTALALQLMQTPDIDLHRANERGNTALLVACAEGLLPVVQELLQRGAYAQTPASAVYSSELDMSSLHSPLSVSISHNHSGVVKLLLQQQQVLQEVDRPLAFAVSRGQRAAKLSGLTALSLAALFGHTDSVLSLLEAGADPLIVDSTGRTLLHHAATGPGGVHVVTVLAERGLLSRFLDAASQSGETALHIGCEHKQVDAVAALLAQGACANARNADGVTPLHVAVRRRSEAAVQQLLEHGADADSEDGRGLSPRHAAAKLSRDCKIATLLLGSPTSKDGANCQATVLSTDE
jgi:uncharacterized protein